MVMLHSLNHCVAQTLAVRPVFARGVTGSVGSRIPGDCLTPPGANPLLAERAFPTSDYGVAQGLPGVQKK